MEVQTKTLEDGPAVKDMGGFPNLMLSSVGWLVDVGWMLLVGLIYSLKLTVPAENGWLEY